MVERYIPGVAAAAFAQSVRRAAAAAAAMSEEGESIRYLGSVFLPGEECSFCCFEAARAESVSEANRRAGVPYWRVVEAIVIER